MSSIISRSTILLFSRTTNLALQIISPVLLVRILDITSYGQYQAFNLYALIISNLCAFGISSNLLYFIQKYPEKLKVLVSQTAFFLFCASVIAISTVITLKGYLISHISIDVYMPLAIYVFFDLNFAFWDTFWLATKKAKYVFYYSSTIMVIKITGLLIVAYLFRDIEYIIWWICIVPVGRFTFVMYNAIKRKWLTVHFDRSLFKEQIIYFMPMGVANALRHFNNSISKIYVAQSLGIEALAVYIIGSRYLPIINLVRSTVVDTILPDIIERGKKGDAPAILLWQKANVILTIIIFPCFVIGEVFANEIISFLFTRTYIDAASIFRLYLILMMLQTFELTLPIRYKNKNVHIIISGSIRFSCNVILLFIFAKSIGLIGPALAAIISGVFECLYLGFAIYYIYNMRISEILLWKKQLKVIGVAFTGFIFLTFASTIFGKNILAIIGYSIIYLIYYLISLSKLNIDEYKLLIKYGVEKINILYIKLDNSNWFTQKIHSK